MEIFCHINEMKELGWASLRTLILACPKVVLWAPSALELEELRRHNPILPDIHEILWYVRNNYIQLMARDWWINNGEERHNHKWPGAKWVEEFDGALLEIWKEDRRKGIAASSSAVRSEPPAKGFEWAKMQIESGLIDYEKLVRNVLANLGESQVDYIKRACQQATVKGKAIYLLGHARNHGEAVERSGRDRVFGVPTDETLINIIIDSLHKESSSRRDLYESTYKPNADTIIAAVDGVFDKMGNYKPVKTQQEAFERMQKVLSDKNEIQILREWITEVDLLAANIRAEYLEGEITVKVAKLLEQGALRKTFRDYFLPKSKLDVAAIAAAVVSGAVGLNTGLWQFGIGLAVPAVKPLLQWLGYVGEDYTGPRWPFYLAEGTNSVRRQTREALFARLKSVK